MASPSSPAAGREPALAAPAPDRPRFAGPLCSAALVYLAFSLFLLWPSIAGGLVLSPAGLWTRTGPFPTELRESVPPGVDILSDSTYAYVPYLRYAADRLARDHHLPVWKATASCGAPFIGNGESAVFFPTVLLAILLGAPPWVHAATALVKLVATGLSAYALSRHLRLSWLASVLGGAIYALGGFQAMYLLFTPTNVSLFLPLMIVLADRLVQRPSASRGALLAVLAALQHLGGHPETAFHCQVLVVLLGAVRAWPLPGRWRRMAALVGSLAGGAALAALQVAPLVEYIAQSDMLYLRRFLRTPIPVLQPWPAAGFLLALALAVWAVHRLKHARSPWLPALALCVAVAGGGLAGVKAGMSCAFATQLMPDWFGTVNHFLGPVNYLIANLGSAGVALPLGVLGLLYGRPRRLALGAGALFAFGTLTGFNAPVLIQVVGALPLFNVAANSRLALWALLALGVLAGLGLDALRRGAGSWPAGARLRLSLAMLAPALGAWLALTASAHEGLIVDTTVPIRLPSDLKVEAGLAAQSGTKDLAWTQPAPEGEGKPVIGWVAPSATPVLIQFIFNAQRDSSVAQWEPLPDSARAALGVPADTSGPVYAIRALLPLDRVPPGPTAVRVWISVVGGTRPEVSDVLHAPDDPGRDQLAFPAQPAGGWLDTQLLLVGATLLVAAAGLGRPALARWLRPALAATVIAGLLVVLGHLLPFLPPELHFPDPPSLPLLETALPNGRMLQMVPHIFAAELPTYYGLYDVRGYDALWPRHVAQMLRAAADAPGDIASIDYLPLRNDVDLGLLGLMSVQFLTDWSAAPRELTRLHYPGEDTLPRSNPFPVIVNPKFLPRARLVSGAVIVEDDDAALSVMSSEKFARDRMVVLAGGTNRDPIDGPAGSATIEIDTPDFVRIAVDVKVPGWLVLSDSFYPGWRAFVDGQRRGLVRANVAFRAVEVNPGDKVVEFAYRPMSFRGGCVLSAVTGAALLGLGLREVVLRRRRAQPGAAAGR